MPMQEVRVPDIGDFKDVPVIEVLVKAGDAVKAEDALVTLESDKATMDVPSPAAGVVKEVKVKAGDKLSEGSLVLVLDTAQASEPAPPPPPSRAAARGSEPAQPAEIAPAPSPPATPPAAETRASDNDAAAFTAAHASPSVRKFARELGVDLAKLYGTGPNRRITHDDVQAFVKDAMTRGASAPAAAAGLDLLSWPKVDFAKFGPIEAVPLSRIRKISGANLARNWVMIPHVTQFDEADITGLEAFRVALNKENEKSGIKVTMLAFLVKACVLALKKFPDFNASLDGDNLVVKNYWHIGFAADTPAGLVVPVIRDADKKGVVDIAKEMGELAKLARDGKNSSWRYILPLSLSWDHRVIDGASAARFNAHFGALLADMRRIVI